MKGGSSQESRPHKLQRKLSPSSSNMAVPDDGESSGSRTLSFVEFYCGVGGWTMALEKAAEEVMAESNRSENHKPISLHCVAALDHSDLCTKVYQHNHCQPDSGATTPTTTSIERLTLKTAERWNADIWAMSPPCQPHTRQHANQQADLEDPRSKSFLHLCHLIETIREEKLPKLILVENVIGFEQSNSCLRMRQVLAHRKYVVGQFHLSPTQCGLPNDRPRYYCVAAQSPSVPSSSVEDQLRKYLHLEENITEDGKSQEKETNDSSEIDATMHSKFHSSIEELGMLPNFDAGSTTAAAIGGGGSSFLQTISTFLNKEDNQNLNLRIPPKLLNSNSAWCFDIVTPGSQRSSCFTHGYGKFVRGTGSVLYFGDGKQQKEEENQYNNNKDNAMFQLVAPDEREFDKDWAKGLDLEHNLRYFSGKELARLLDFRADFDFPKDTTLKQQWKLMGNSLNVRVASKMCQLGLRAIL